MSSEKGEKKPGNDLLSHGLSRSTIGDEAFHCRVRDGNVCFRFSMATSTFTLKGRKIFPSCESSIKSLVINVKKKPGNDLLSHGLSRSTIGDEAFHCRVRDGNVCCRFSMVTRKFIMMLK